MRTFCLLLVIGILTGSCTSSSTKEENTPQELEFDEAMTADKAFCQVIREVDFGNGPSIYLLDICPGEGADLDVAINIAQEGEPSVTVLFDTLLSFPSESAARTYAEENDVFDIQL